MASVSIFPPYPSFFDVAGKPLENAYIWIGTANLDPQTNPIAVYWDSALTIPADQPIRTLGGYPVRNGTPAQFYVGVTDYSIRVQDKNGIQQYYTQDATQSVSFIPDGQSLLTTNNVSDALNALSNSANGSAYVGYTQSGGSAQPRTVQEKLRDSVSVFDFMTSAQIAQVRAGTSTNDSAAIQAAISTGKSVTFPAGSYRAANLTQSTMFQRFYADGDVKIFKCANGPIITFAGNDVECNGISFRGESATPSFTGDNVVATGVNFRMINCGSRWAFGRAVKATGSHCQIIGTCDIYQTADTTASGFDIELGVSGTATLYHHISQVYSSLATGGIRTIDTGSVSIVGSQFGKLTVANGTGPAGVNGGMFVGNRILGDVSVNVSGSTFAANQFGGSSITFAAGTALHQFYDNPVSNSTTITDNSTGSVIIDPRVAVQTNYTPVWTAAVTNPVLGNGTLQGVYTRTGKRVDVQIYLAIGSTTTLGSGTWYLTLPFAASTTNTWVGAAHGFISGTANYSLTVSTLLDGTSRIVLNADGAASNVNSSTPAAWVSGSFISISLTYYTPA